MNVNNPAVKRIMGELKELTKGARPDDFFVAAPMEDNLFECTSRFAAQRAPRLRAVCTTAR